MTVAAFDVLLIGHVSRDRLTMNGRTEARAGGGVYYGCFPLRQMGLRVGVVTRLHCRDVELVDEMERAGVQVFAASANETTQIENTYFAADQEERISRMTGFAGPFQAGDLPDGPRRVTLISPMAADEIDLGLVRQVARRGPLALDVQGFTRRREAATLVSSDWRDKAAGLALATYVKLDRAEAQVLTGRDDPGEAIREIAAWGPREILITYNGAVMLYAEGQIHRARIVPHVQNGRTGRGDTCFAAYAGRRLTAGPVPALHFAAALTSVKLEQPGPFRGDLDAVQERLAETFEEATEL